MKLDDESRLSPNKPVASRPKMPTRNTMVKGAFRSDMHVANHTMENLNSRNDDRLTVASTK